MNIAELLQRTEGLTPSQSSWEWAFAELGQTAITMQDEEDGTQCDPPPEESIALAQSLLGQLKAVGFPPPSAIGAHYDSVHLHWYFNYTEGRKDYTSVWVDANVHRGVDAFVTDDKVTTKYVLED